MIRASRPLVVLALLLATAGCAGGWRHGVPAQWAADATVSAPVASPAKSSGGPAVSADGVTFRYSGEGSSVNLAGEFNSWSTSADPLKKSSDGTWTITKKLSPGRYAYKFVIDGGTWKTDPAAKESVDDGFGGKNGIIVVGAGAAPAAPVAATAAASGVKGASVSADGALFRYSGAANSVNLAGEFNSWSTSADPLTKGADGVWTITKKLNPGRYAYKFVVDGTNWKEDPTAKETTDDGFGGKNAIVVVGAGAAAAAPVAATAAASGAQGASVSGEGTVFRYSGAANSVNLAGEFNSWSTSADPLTKGADGVWTITKKLAPGRYAYKFVLDGTNWKEDPTAKETTDDGFGGKNAIVVVSGTASSASTSTTSATSATIAVTGKPKAPVIGADGVRFTYAGAASSVALCGDFNGWATQTDPMKQQSDGTWTIVRKLSPGSHAYKFLIDGKVWRLDEANPSTQDDDFGGKNSVITVK